MPVNSIESRPNITSPLQSVEKRDETKIAEINVAVQQASGIETPQPVHQEGQRITIEVNEPSPAPTIAPSSETTSAPALLNKLGSAWERFTNWRRTFLMNRFGTTKSKEGLDASVERAVDKAESQGQHVTSIKT